MFGVSFASLPESNKGGHSMFVAGPGFSFGTYKFTLAADYDPSKIRDYMKSGGLPVTSITKIDPSTTSAKIAVSSSSESNANVEFKKLAEMMASSDTLLINDSISENAPDTSAVERVGSLIAMRNSLESYTHATVRKA
jgi:hypothetical protein